MNYGEECEYGREIAASEISDCAITGNYPKLIRAVRQMAAENNAVSVGFFQKIAEMAVAKILNGE